MAQAVGHDLNYIAQAGVLGLIGRHGQPPTPPLSLIGDFGGGGLLLALGILAAVVERSLSGRGPGRRRRDGRGRRAAGHAVLRLPADRAPGTRSAARTSSTAARRSTTPTSAPTASTLTVAAMEPKFYAALVELLGLTGPARSARSGALAGDEGALRRGDPHPHARRVVRRRRGDRGVRRPGARRRRGGRRPAPRRPRHVRARARPRAARARAALQPHARPRSPAARRSRASTPPRRSPTGASTPPRSPGSPSAARSACWSRRDEVRRRDLRRRVRARALRARRTRSRAAPRTRASTASG